MSMNGCRTTCCDSQRICVTSSDDAKRLCNDSVPLCDQAHLRSVFEKPRGPDTFWVTGAS